MPVCSGRKCSRSILSPPRRAGPGRVVLGIGRQDLSGGGVTFLQPGLAEVGRSADYLVVEVAPGSSAPAVGSMIDMLPAYEALVAAWTSPYVEVRFEAYENGGRFLMCGIIGYVGDRECRDILFRGLRKLEYRGYDSAGISIVHEGSFKLLHSVGNLDNLEAVLPELGDGGTVGIAHTRWATHGRPSNENAHPHTDCGGRFAIVLNGIVENYLSLRAELQGEGHEFTSETDAEVVAHLIERAYRGFAARRGGRGLPPDGGAFHLLRRGGGRAGCDRGGAQGDPAGGGA